MRPTLAIIGGGELEPALRQAAADAGVNDQVSFMGVRKHDEALRLLRRSKVLVLPSRAEGLPVSIIEAMHLGVPTVASRVGGTPELIEDGMTGFLADPGDVEGFAGCIRRILSDPGLAKSLSAQARWRAQTLFSDERTVSLHAALYHQLPQAA